jgi:hypothetical protein
MPFYKKIKPIPKFAEEPLYLEWLKTFKKEGTEAAFYALADSFPSLAGLPLNEWMPSLKSEARYWSKINWMEGFPKECMVAPKTTQGFRAVLVHEAKKTGIEFGGGHGQHPRWLVNGIKDNDKANALMQDLAAKWEEKIRSVPGFYDCDLDWFKMKQIVNFKRRTLFYQVKDQLVIEYHKSAPHKD